MVAGMKETTVAEPAEEVIVAAPAGPAVVAGLRAAIAVAEAAEETKAAAEEMAAAAREDQVAGVETEVQPGPADLDAQAAHARHLPAGPLALHLRRKAVQPAGVVRDLPETPAKKAVPPERAAGNNRKKVK
jgi:hypothetical protein